MLCDDVDEYLMCGDVWSTGVGISGEGLLTPAGSGEVAPDGIISYYPEFSQFGEFRNGQSSCVHKLT